MTAFPDKTDRSADCHETETGPHDSGNSHIHTSLNRGVVDQSPHFLRHHVILIQLNLDDFSAQGKAFQRFDLLNEVGTELKTSDTDDTVLIGGIGAKFFTVLIFQVLFGEPLTSPSGLSKYFTTNSAPSNGNPIA